jgi:Tfp pilus assembly protein PilF
MGLILFRLSFVCAVGLLLARNGAAEFLSGIPQGGQAKTHAENGLRMAQSGNLQLAEEELRKAVAMAPANAVFLSNLGTILAMENKLEESTTFFQNALKLNSTDLASREYLAANLWQLHRYVEAKEQLRILLKAKPGDKQASLLLGMVSENAGDYATAVKMLSTVPELVRAHPESMGALARSYYRIGEREKAELWIKELQNHPGGAPAALLGAQIADEMRDYATAESVLESLQPSFADPTGLSYRLALVKFHAKQFAESRAILQNLVDGEHKTGEILRLLGWSFEKEGRYDDAVREFREAIQLHPTEEQNYLDLGSILLAERRIAPALELARRTAGAFPQSPRAFSLQGSAELAAEQFRDAIESFTRTLQLDENSKDATIGLAKAQAGAGLTSQAKMTLESAMRRVPKNAAFELELALLFLKETEAGNALAQTRAEQLLRAAAEHDDELVEAHYHLGDMALRRGQGAEALVHLEKAAELAPRSAKVHFALSRTYRRLGKNAEASKEMELYETLKEKEALHAPSTPTLDPASK